jgi:hypothetical protein
MSGKLFTFLNKSKLLKYVLLMECVIIKITNFNLKKFKRN